MRERIHRSSRMAGRAVGGISQLVNLRAYGGVGPRMKRARSVRSIS